MHKIERSLSDAIVDWLTARTEERDKRTTHRFGSMAELRKAALEDLGLERQGAYLVSVFDMDVPRNRGEYRQIWIVNGEEAARIIEDTSLELNIGIVNIATAETISLSILDEGRMEGLELTIDFYR